MLPASLSESALAARLARQEHEIASLCREVLDRYEEATCVYRLSERIGTVLGERSIAQLVVDDAAAVLGARSAEIWFRTTGGAALAASSGPAGAEPGPSVADVLAEGRPVAGDGDAGSAWAAVPLPDASGGALGVLVLRGRPEGRRYLTGEVKLLGAIAAVAAAFIRNERLVENARLVEARRREDEIARQVHRGLLPREDPLFAGLEISGGFRPAEIVGGDYYGYVAMADGSLGLAIADVSGHGVGAALYMATARGALHSEARDLLSPADVLRRVNEVLATDFSAADMFATFVFARFLPDGRRFVWSNAGHHPPLVLRATGEIETLKPCGPALGIVAGARWRDADTRFAPDDLLLLYTDGVVEARDAAGTFFGVDRLVTAARRPGRTAAEIRGAVLDALAAHTGSLPPRDDVTLVVIRGTAIEEAP
ncbi:MAG TPA: PP2C family protein-serine/threonine phosphatase [Candidatus Polarisedimenticolaceae bacterium]|nr:PP2C family protein-serine/threonine phosphatase [Candidatus Polarisedimenticolaceae bacterium]